MRAQIWLLTYVFGSIKRWSMAVRAAHEKTVPGRRLATAHTRQIAAVDIGPIVVSEAADQLHRPAAAMMDAP